MINIPFSVARTLLCSPRHGKVSVILALLCIACAGCRVSDILPAGSSGSASASSGVTVSDETLMPGVVHRVETADNGTQVDIIDTDLSAAQVVPKVIASHVELSGGKVAAAALTPAEWQLQTHAVAVVNGGYFGEEHADGTKDVVGLLVQAGRVRHAAPPLRGAGSPGVQAGYYMRSACGVMSDGTPSITWAGTEVGHPQRVLSYAHPTAKVVRGGTEWPVWEAVGCGPTLYQHGRSVVTARQERLVSPEERPRTFLAYDVVAGVPAHFVIGVAASATYSEVATFLKQYFNKFYNSNPEAAMCVDGGSSTQLTYLGQDGVHSPIDTGIAVPDCIALCRK